MTTRNVFYFYLFIFFVGGYSKPRGSGTLKSTPLCKKTDQSGFGMNMQEVKTSSFSEIEATNDAKIFISGNKCANKRTRL